MATRLLASMTLAALVLPFAVAAQSPDYPVWLQSEGPWADQPLTGTTGTVGELGCALVAVAMQLRGLGKTIDGKPVDPAVLNGKLDDLHVWKMAALAGMKLRVVTGRVDEALARGAVVLQIRYVAPASLGGNVAPHFVLAVARERGRILVHDPLKGRRPLDPEEPLDQIRSAWELY